jgi:glycosyltransferase involved in cell wall biosynthesis
MKFLIVAGFAEDLLPFRGDLIDALLKKGIEVHVILPDLVHDSDLQKKLLAKGLLLHSVTMQKAGMNPFADLHTLWQLVQLMRTIRPDVVFTYLIKSVIYGLLAATINGVPRRYALISGLGYAFQGDDNSRVLLRRIAQGLYALSLRGAHKVFFQNPDDLKLFYDLRILKANAATCVVNGSGVNMDHYAFTPIPKGVPRFLSVARLLRDKGVREYAAAAKIVKGKYPNASFSIVGWIDENPSAIKQAELDAWIAEGTINYIGRLADVRPAIADCGVFVLPSYREGTPRSVLEAMSMGRAIITTDAPGCRETVVNEDNGLLVPVGTVDELAIAMERFLENPQLAQRMGQRSREVVEDRYDVHKVNQVMLNEMKIN